MNTKNHVADHAATNTRSQTDDEHSEEVKIVADSNKCAGYGKRNNANNPQGLDDPASNFNHAHILYGRGGVASVWCFWRISFR